MAEILMLFITKKEKQLEKESHIKSGNTKVEKVIHLSFEEEVPLIQNELSSAARWRVFTSFLVKVSSYLSLAFNE